MPIPARTANVAADRPRQAHSPWPDHVRSSGWPRLGSRWPAGGARSGGAGLPRRGARWVVRRYGCQGLPRDTVTRALAHEPLGWRPTTLLVTVRRYRCSGCVARSTR